MRFFLLTGFLALAGAAHAQSPVFQVAKGSMSVVNVLVTDAAVNVDSSTRTLTGRFTMEVFNDDSTNSVFCGPNDTVSATATATNYGRRISPRSSMTYAIPYTIKLWCISDVAAGARLVLTQLH